MNAAVTPRIADYLERIAARDSVPCRIAPCAHNRILSNSSCPASKRRAGDDAPGAH